MIRAMRAAATIGAFGAVSAPAGAQTLGRPTDQFPIGETLEYEAKWGLLRLGRASMQVVGVDTIRGEPTVHFQFLLRGRALGVYRMNDQFDSWVGYDDFLSRRFTQHFDETGNQRETAYEIYPDSGLYWEMGVDTAKVASKRPLDDTAFFYFVRTLELEPGERLTFDNYFRPDRNPVVVNVIERDTIDVPAGRFPTIVIQPIVQGGLFGDNKDGRMWISDDDRRVIVQMKTKIIDGVTITMRLTDILEAPPETDPGSPRSEPQ